MLEDLALRCGQAGAMQWLEHFLAVPTFRGKKPYVVFGIDDEAEATWAALLYEMTPLGLATGIFVSDDISGFRSVIALPAVRSAVAAKVAEILLERRAQIVMISSLKAASDPISPRSDLPTRWAVRERSVTNTLIAADTYEATLMSLGKATRFNMRYYRRRLMRQKPYTLVQNACGLFTAAEFEAFNAATLNPAPSGLMQMQYTSASTLPGGFLLGIRAEDGTWLGVVGGWRQAETTVLLWQMNRAGFERESIGTVMRGHFVEHEVSRGARRIVFYGGTPNSIQNSFERNSVEDLVVVRRSRKAALLLKLAALVAKPGRWLKTTNFLAATLHDDALEWHETASLLEQLK